MFGPFFRDALSRGGFSLVTAILIAALGPVSRAQQQSPQLQERDGAVAPHVESEQPLNDYQRSQMAEWARDFADLHRYRAANQELGSPVSGEHRIIFYGDSITDKWALSQYFPGRSYINRGISGHGKLPMFIDNAVPRSGWSCFLFRQSLGQTEHAQSFTVICAGVRIA